MQGRDVARDVNNGGVCRKMRDECAERRRSSQQPTDEQRRSEKKIRTRDDST